VLRRRLGSSSLEVSAVAVGCWQTFERIPREAGLHVLRAARERGVTFFDTARYDDHFGTAPISTGYSEVLFGELFRASGWRRDEAVIATKLWWEHWPDETAEQELDGSLARTGLGRYDLVYSDPPPERLPIADVVGAIGGLLAGGKAGAWGVVNWPAERIAQAAGAAAEQGLPAPCAAQLAYSLVRRSPVEDADMVAALRACGASVVASFALAGGALTGKYDEQGADGRLAGRGEDPALAPARAAGRELRALARELATTPAALAIAFTMANPDVASVLVGATSAAQVAENAASADLHERLGDAGLARLRALST
jgi:L-glyceraldehyde 3-phosphate reductase